MKTQFHSFAAVLALALSVGLMAGCSQQAVEEELLGLGKDRPSGESVPEEIHATLKKDEGGNRTCTTYDHPGSHGTRWRTKWC
jgi:hypothetical protein